MTFLTRSRLLIRLAAKTAKLYTIYSIVDKKNVKQRVLGPEYTTPRGKEIATAETLRSNRAPDIRTYDDDGGTRTPKCTVAKFCLVRCFQRERSAILFDLPLTSSSSSYIQHILILQKKKINTHTHSTDPIDLQRKCSTASGITNYLYTHTHTYIYICNLDLVNGEFLRTISDRPVFTTHNIFFCVVNTHTYN